MTFTKNSLDKERLTLVCLLFAVFCLICVDLGLDLNSGESLTSIAWDIVLECSILSIVIYTAYYIWQRFREETISRQEVEKNLVLTTRKAKIWEKKSKQYVFEFQVHIKERFEEWSLSKSEKDIAIMLMQGKSSKDIAQFRSTSERTIRNQCQSIYEKSKRNGRQELSSYFFDELLDSIDIDS